MSDEVRVNLAEAEEAYRQRTYKPLEKHQFVIEESMRPERMGSIDSEIRQMALSIRDQLDQVVYHMPVDMILCLHEGPMVTILPGEFDQDNFIMRVTDEYHIISRPEDCTHGDTKTQYGPKPRGIRPLPR